MILRRYGNSSLTSESWEFSTLPCTAGVLVLLLSMSGLSSAQTITTAAGGDLGDGQPKMWALRR